MMTNIITPSPQRMRELRETHGLLEAKKIAGREALEQAIQTATSIDDIKVILMSMLKNS